MKKTKTNFISSKGNSGFTLLEMLVGISVFILLISIITTIFISSISAQRRSIQMQNVIDNSRYAIEIMSRATRMSELLRDNDRSYLQSDQTSTSLLLCHPTKGTKWLLGSSSCDTQLAYSLSFPNIMEREDGGARQLTGENVNVANLNFRIWGTAGDYNGDGINDNDNTQPRVTVTVKVTQPSTFLKPEAKEEIYLQTTITPRKLDI